MWLIHLVNLLLGYQLNQFGLVPRSISHFTAIFYWSFLHGSFDHLLTNSIPFTILGLLVAVRGSNYFFLTTLFISIASGIVVWLFGRAAIHIGASVLIYGYFGFLVSRAWFDRSPISLIIALIVVITYSGLIFGLFPNTQQVSWEGHLAGLLSGGLMAWLLYKQTPTKKKLQE
ncbi:rhomboid family intramembrane serine protease [Zooshikella marina]|uniref:rhomboid family intramembrane serine protease n=1 Tax=Zooshikella ganghwensis TaxID=202772 RepID=UPI001BAEEBC1|nr:rhomboid family intramembrane serine protease [Zooshikella ganghwensis]MBU2708010.1 rhomboid family intramembrane serine protease [Zooshikella ganghwensis]